MNSTINPLTHRSLKRQSTASAARALVLGVAVPAAAATVQVADKPEVNENLSEQDFNQSMQTYFKPLVESNVPAFAKPDEKLSTDEVLKKYGTDEESMTVRLLSMAKSLPSRLFQFAKKAIFGLLQIIPLLHRNGVLVPLMILLIPTMLVYMFIPFGLPGSALSVAKAAASTSTLPIEVSSTAGAAATAATDAAVDIPVGAWQKLMPILTGTLAVIVAAIYGIHTFITSGALRRIPKKEVDQDEQEKKALIEDEKKQN